MKQQNSIGGSIAQNLSELSKQYKSSDPVQATKFKREFKDRSKNDLVRSIVYLLEVVGSRDQQFKAVQEENKDLRELLKLNNIELDEQSPEAALSNPAGDDGPKYEAGSLAPESTPAP